MALNVYLIFYDLPNDASHFVAVHVNDGICNFDSCVYHMKDISSKFD